MKIGIQLDKLKAWLNERDTRERVFLALMVVAVTYVLWNLLIDRALLSHGNTQTSQIDATSMEIKTIHEQLKNIQELVNSNTYLQKVQQQKMLSALSQNFQQRIENLATTAVAAKDLPEVTTDILKLQGITLVELKSLPSEPWIPTGLSSVTLPENTRHIEKYNMQIEFYSDYFGTMDYLSRLEKLPWHLYWDNVDYTVTQYPKADVKIKLYVLTTQVS